MLAKIRLAVLVLIMLGLLGYLGYVVATRPINCVTPVVYELVVYDTAFGLPKEEILKYIHDAVAVWNTALGKEILVEGTNPKLPIRFEYDASQQTVDAVSTISSQIDATKKQQSAAADEYATLKEEYDAARAEGRATQAMADQLDLVLKKYYTLKDKVSADIALGNSLIPKDEFEDGRYVSDNEGQRIYVYAFQNKRELMRTLIHEFGHALELEHVSNPDSIMYPMNKSTSLVLSAEDKAELVRACAQK